jgi:NtrC-family two-component system response regulator AlgB
LLAFFNRQTSRRIEAFSPAARIALSNHTWPGNLRELRNAVERAVLFASGPLIELGDLPERIGSGTSAQPGAGTAIISLGSSVTLEQIEAEHIRRVLERCETREEAARILGIDPSTLYRKRRQFGL